MATYSRHTYCYSQAVRVYFLDTDISTMMHRQCGSRVFDRGLCYLRLPSGRR
jgi:hypothetical protein